MFNELIVLYLTVFSVLFIDVYNLFTDYFLFKKIFLIFTFW
jgi:hypothetical protein